LQFQIPAMQQKRRGIEPFERQGRCHLRMITMDVDIQPRIENTA
jgi:hypothetical protein